MALKNSQYDAVMRHYDEIRDRNRRRLEERTEEIYRKIPEMEKLDQASVELSLSEAKARILDPGRDPGEYRAKLKEISGRKTALLFENGYPGDYLELKYDCPACRDTGLLPEGRCSCFTRTAAAVLYGNLMSGQIIRNAGFESFSFDWYSDKIADETTGKTPRETARGALSAAKRLLDGGRETGLYIYGNTGTGKTWLSLCTANEAGKRGLSVLYFSADDFFRILADSDLRDHDRISDANETILGCDLLIIDDLGTELANSYTATALFRTINSRILQKKSTIISSNLSLADLRARYTERISSRIISDYALIRLIGDDIRIQRKQRNNMEDRYDS